VVALFVAHVYNTHGMEKYKPEEETLIIDK
jgi:hypothetical protein